VVRVVLVACVAVPFLSGCAFFGFDARSPDAADPSESVYRAAMADLSTCITTADPTARAAALARLTEAAGAMAAETRPTNPDHFFMSDRVAAGAAFCAEAIR
jgi:hypothetical protein